MGRAAALASAGGAEKARRKRALCAAAARRYRKRNGERCCTTLEYADVDVSLLIRLGLLAPDAQLHDRKEVARGIKKLLRDLDLGRLPKKS